MFTDHESLRFSVLSQLAKRLLILPHSNADPERLFSMMRNIVTYHRKRLDSSTIIICDLLSTKVNNSKPCFDNSHLLSDDFLKLMDYMDLRDTSVRKNLCNFWQTLIVV